MSLIEDALNKARQTPSTVASPNWERRVRQLPTADVTSRSFRAAATDPEAIRRNHVLLGVTDPAVTRGYKILRTRVLHRLAANNWRSVGITGTVSGEGKSLTALNLALALAQEVNTWVFLVDLDLQRSQIGSYLGLSVEHGLTDYLTGQATLDQCVYDIGVRRLGVVPNVRRAENSSEFLTSPRMSEFVEALLEESPRRVIVFDMPPLLASDDVIAFGRRADSHLLVVSPGHTARRTLDNAKEMLAEMNLLGVVLNRSTEHNDSPYY